MKIKIPITLEIEIELDGLSKLDFDDAFKKDDVADIVLDILNRMDEYNDTWTDDLQNAFSYPEHPEYWLVEVTNHRFKSPWVKDK